MSNSKYIWAETLKEASEEAATVVRQALQLLQIDDQKTAETQDSEEIAKKQAQRDWEYRGGEWDPRSFLKVEAGNEVVVLWRGAPDSPDAGWVYGELSGVRGWVQAHVF